MTWAILTWCDTVTSSSSSSLSLSSDNMVYVCGLCLDISAAFSMLAGNFDSRWGTFHTSSTFTLFHNFISSLLARQDIQSYFTFMHHKFLVLTVKKWLKSMYIYRCYCKIENQGDIFGPLCRTLLQSLLQGMFKVQNVFVHRQWAAANCTMPPIANASNCKLLLFWFPCKL